MNRVIIFGFFFFSARDKRFVQGRLKRGLRIFGESSKRTTLVYVQSGSRGGIPVYIALVHVHNIITMYAYGTTTLILLHPLRIPRGTHTVAIKYTRPNNGTVLQQVFYGSINILSFNLHHRVQDINIISHATAVQVKYKRGSFCNMV